MPGSEAPRGTILGRAAGQSRKARGNLLRRSLPGDGGSYPSESRSHLCTHSNIFMNKANIFILIIL